MMATPELKEIQANVSGQKTLKESRVLQKDRKGSLVLKDVTDLKVLYKIDRGRNTAKAM